MTEELPSIDGNYVKPKSKSRDRHRRETAYKIAAVVGLSVTKCYIWKVGEAERKERGEGGKHSAILLDFTLRIFCL